MKNILSILSVGTLAMFLMFSCANTGKSGTNPCGANPCASNPCAGNPCSGNMMNMSRAEMMGKKLWMSKSLGTSGRTCKTCHPNGVGLNFKSYPKYINMAKRTMQTLPDMINFCIKTPLKGRPIAATSKKMKALVAYYNKLAKSQ